MKKALSLLLALVMCLSLFPVSVFADDGTDIEEPAGDLIVEEPVEPAEELEAEPAGPEEELPAEDTETPEEPVEESEEPAEEPAGPAEEPEEPAEEPEELAEEPEEPAEEPEEELEASLEGENILTADNFPDPNLLAALCEKFPDGISAAAAAEYTEKLELYEKDISDAAGLADLFPKAGFSLLRNPLTSFDASGMTNPDSVLDLSDCGKLTELILKSGEKKCAAQNIYAVGTSISTLDAAGLTTLKLLLAGGSSRIKRIDVSGCTALTYLKNEESGLESINLNGCAALKELYLSRNHLTYLDLSSCPKLFETGGTLSCDGQTAAVNARGWSFGDCTFVDLVADGIIGSDVQTSPYISYYSPRSGAFFINSSAGYTEYFLPFYVMCKNSSGGTFQMSVLVTVIKESGSLLSVPDYAVLSRDEGAKQIKAASALGGTLGAEQLSNLGMNMYLYVVGNGGIADSPNNPATYNSTTGKYDYSTNIAGDVLTPLNAGYASVICELRRGDNSHVLQQYFIRVDVVAGALSTPDTGAGVTGVSLLESSAVVELYRTDYATLTPILTIERNLVPSNVLLPEEELPETPDNGVAIVSAEFTDSTAAAWLELHPESDRFLKIVPVYSMMEKAYNKLARAPGSLKSKVRLTLSDGGVFETGQLSISLKTTQPKVSMKPVAFNSWTDGGRFNPFKKPEISVTPKQCNVLSFALVGSIPDWMVCEDGTIDYHGPDSAKLSATVGVEYEVEGFAVRPTGSVKVTAKPTPPKVTVSASSVTILGSGNDCASVRFSAQLAGYGDITRLLLNRNFSALRVTEGSGKTMSTYDVSEVLDVQYNKNSGIMTVGLPAPCTEAHTYKLWYSYINTERCLTVKVLPDANPSLTVKPAKGAGTIDLSFPGSRTAFTVTGKNCGRSLYTNGNDIIVNVTGPLPDADSCFEKSVSSDGITLILDNPGGLTEGKYTLNVELYVGCAENGGYAKGSCSFSVKSSKAGALPLKLTAKGKLEAYQTCETVLTLSSKFYSVNAAMNGGLEPAINSGYGLRFYSGADCDSAEAADSSFTVNKIDTAGGSISISCSATAEPGSYWARIEYEPGWSGGQYNPTVFSNPVRLTVKGSAPKLLQSAKELTLTRNDRYTSAVLRVGSEYANRGIMAENVYIARSSASCLNYIDVHTVANADGTADILLSWKEGGEYLKPGKSLTVKLEVYYSSDSAVCKPSVATVKLKIK